MAMKFSTKPIEAVTAIGAGIAGAIAGGVILQKIPPTKPDTKAGAVAGATVVNPLRKFAPLAALAAGVAGVVLIPNKHAKNACAGLAVIGGFAAVGELTKKSGSTGLVPTLSGFGEFGDAEYTPTYPVSGFGNLAFEGVDTFEGVDDQVFEGIDDGFEGVDDGIEGVDDGIEGVDDGIEGVDEDLSGPTDIDVENGRAYIQGIGNIQLP